MPLNESEEYLFRIGYKSFLNLWALPNPYWGSSEDCPIVKRDELCDLLVVFGNDVIVFSDKSNSYPDTQDENLNWKRWYRRTISNSVKQLKKAKIRLLMPGCAVFDGHKSENTIHFRIPGKDDIRIHLLAVARTAGDICEKNLGRRSLNIDTGVFGDEENLCVGTSFDGDLVHIFDELSFDSVMNRFDTIRDFLSYLKEKELFFSEYSVRVEGEQNLVAYLLDHPVGPAVYKFPRFSPSGKIQLKDGLWKSYKESEKYAHTVKENVKSYAVDRIINQFSENAREGLVWGGGDLTLAEHEAGLRILASESRFSRRMIVETLMEIWWEENQKTTWFMFMESKDNPGVSYLLMTYPASVVQEMENIENWSFQELTKKMIVSARQFSPKLLVGLAIPNREAKFQTFIIRILNSENIGLDFDVDLPVDEKTRFDTSKSQTKAHYD